MSDDDSEEFLGDLQDEVESRTNGDASSTTDDDRHESPSPSEADIPDEEPTTEGATPEESGSYDGPLGGLRRDVESRKRDDQQSKAGREPGIGGDDGPEADHFVEQNVDEVDTDELWADLLFEDEEPPTGSFEAADDLGDEPGTVVSKSLCHRCQYFGDPPQLHCTHEGTTIHELLDMGHYRVTDCPMVDENVEEQS